MTIGNTPSINSKIDLPELNNTAKKETKTQAIEQNKPQEHTHDIKDSVDVEQVPSGKKEVIKSISIPDSTSPASNVSKKDSAKIIDSHIKEIEKVLQRKNPGLELKDKEEILNILNKSKSDNTLKDLAGKLDKDKKLMPLYHSMGTLVNQGTGGAATSGILALFTFGGTLIAEAKENKAFAMRDMLKDAHVNPEILEKLK